MAKKFRLDHKGMAEMLCSTFALEAVEDAADLVCAVANAAPELDRHGANVDVMSGVMDYRGKGGPERARALITIMHPGGLGMEAKHGTLSRALASVMGVEMDPAREMVDYVNARGKKSRITKAQADNYNSRKR